jgi:hypothetical protein
MTSTSPTTTIETGNEQEAPKQPILDEETWKVLREAYKKIKECRDNKEPGDVALFNAMENDGVCGFRVPFEVRHSPGKGRGIFVTQFIAKDTCIWDDRSGHFFSRSDWRKFLSLLPHDLARDVVTWTYAYWWDDERQVVGLDLDEASLMNHAGNTVNYDGTPVDESDEKPNVHNHYDGKMWHLHASRDIQAGEELLCDYHDCHDYEDTCEWYDETWHEYVEQKENHGNRN